MKELFEKMMKVSEDLEVNWEDKVNACYEKWVVTNRDVKYMSFTIPKGTKGFIVDTDGSALEIRYDGRDDVLEVGPAEVDILDPQP